MFIKISDTKPQTGYILQEENESEVALVRCTKNGKRFDYELLETFNKEDFWDLKNQLQVYAMFETPLTPQDTVYVRDEVFHLIPKV
jgi:hypothetical protein